MKGTHWLAVMSCFNLALAASAALAQRGEVEHTALPVVFPGSHWAEKSPSQVGLDAAKLEALKEATQAKEGCVIRHGYLVYQWGDISTVRRWASAYKPVNSTMLLFALKEGLIDSVDDPIRSWVQQVFSGKDLIVKDQTMTFRHLCNMTSAYALPEAPGSAWGYNDRGIALKRMLLYGYERQGGGIHGVFGEDSDRAQMNENRLGALQFEDKPDFRGGGGRLSVRDFARIGWFWHNKGKWQGRQLLPRSYFDQYMTSQVPAALPRTRGGKNDYLEPWSFGGGTNQTPHGPGAYGFNWWFNPEHRLLRDVPADIIHANGNWNKRALTIFPSLDIVVAWNEAPWGQNGEGPDVIPDLNNILRKIPEAVVSVEPAQSANTGPKLEKAVTEKVYFTRNEKPLLSFGGLSDSTFFAADDAYDYAIHNYSE